MSEPNVTPTDKILAHWRTITQRSEVNQHEAGFRRVIEGVLKSLTPGCRQLPPLDQIPRLQPRRIQHEHFADMEMD